MPTTSTLARASSGWWYVAVPATIALSNLMFFYGAIQEIPWFKWAVGRFSRAIGGGNGGAVAIFAAVAFPGAVAAGFAAFLRSGPRGGRAVAAGVLAAGLVWPALTVLAVGFAVSVFE